MNGSIRTEQGTNYEKLLRGNEAKLDTVLRILRGQLPLVGNESRADYLEIATFFSDELLIKLTTPQDQELVTEIRRKREKMNPSDDQIAENTLSWMLANFYPEEL